MYQVLKSNDDRWALLEGNRVVAIFFHEEDAEMVRDIMEDLANTTYALAEAE